MTDSTDLITRNLALNILTQHQKTFAQAKLHKYLDQYSLTNRDRALVTEIVYGVTRQHYTLQHIIKKYSHHSPRKKYLQYSLFIGLYQLLFLDKIPDYAAIHSTVEVARKKISHKETRYLNAILRRVQADIVKQTQQEANDFLPVSEDTGWKFSRPIFPDPINDSALYRSIVYSYPLALVKRWHKNFSSTTVRQLLLSGNRAAPIIARIRPQYDITMSLEKLEPYKAKLIEKDFISLANSGSITQLPGFKEGEWVVEGLAPAAVISSLELKDSIAILDLCAAPGGKSFHIADLLHNTAVVISCDKSLKKLKKMAKAKERLALDNLCLISLDAGKLPKKFYSAFDIVLLDAPCSNSGVLGKRADARWRFSTDALVQLQKQQMDLLASAAHAVKIEGTLLYSTCSIEKEENEQVVKQFLSTHPQFRIMEQKQMLPLPPHFDGGTFCKLIKTR